MTQSAQPGPEQPGSAEPLGWQSQPRQPRPAAPPPPVPPPSWTASLTSTAPVPGPAGFFYADVPNRIVAYIIDAIIVGILNFVVGVVLVGIFGVNVLGLIVWLLGSFAVSAGYFVYSWSSMRGTPGMKLLGMQIGHESDGRSISTQQGLMRWAVLVIPLVLLEAIGSYADALSTLFSIVGLVWLVALLYSISTSPTKQGYHDRIAHTIMVKSARRAA